MHYVHTDFSSHCRIASIRVRLKARSGWLAVQDARTGWLARLCETGSMVRYYGFRSLHDVDRDSGFVADMCGFALIRRIQSILAKSDFTEWATVGIARGVWCQPTTLERSGKVSMDGMAKRTNQVLGVGCVDGVENEKIGIVAESAFWRSLTLTTRLRFSRDNYPPCT